MSFASPLVLLGLLALPIAVVIYVSEHRRRSHKMEAMVAAKMRTSVAPRSPGWRRHAPYAFLLLGLFALILAAAKPQHAVLKPVKGATVMLVNDTSASMGSDDVPPSRLAAAKQAAASFLQHVSPSTQVGSIAFARHVLLLQSPTTDHSLTSAAIASIKQGGGGTSMGAALAEALHSIRTAPKVGDKRAPGSIILISDGASNLGINPVTVAARARHAKVKIFTISIGTATGTAMVPTRNGPMQTSVPVDPTELFQIARTAGGTPYSAADPATVTSIYNDLASVLGHQRVEDGIVGVFAGVGLVLVALGAALSLLWFARLA
ncbi:MAG TPA: VWA domain-containing protein [Solirubrobacteraceae bacterium]|nr:VWA domain-containing protein [Solirubrobacteraceae bacterium]